MKAFKLLILFLFSALFIHAQEGDIQIEQDEKIVALLDIYKEYNKSNEYYRIQVGFGSHDQAMKIKSDFEIDFPNLYSRVDFDSPTYRVRAGRFKSKLDAERKFSEVRKKYPNAMLLKPKKSTR